MANNYQSKKLNPGKKLDAKELKEQRSHQEAIKAYYQHTMTDEHTRRITRAQVVVEKAQAVVADLEWLRDVAPDKIAECDRRLALIAKQTKTTVLAPKLAKLAKLRAQVAQAEAELMDEV